MTGYGGKLLKKIAWSRVPIGSHLELFNNERVTFLCHMKKPYLRIIDGKGLISTVTDSMVKTVLASK